MGRKKSDAYGVGRVQDVLHLLGCPDVRPAQGTAEWKQVQGSFASTPDLAAGPLVGGGGDFMIDVFEPSGDPYVKERAGNPNAAQTFRDAVEKRGSFTLGDLGDNYEHFYGPLTKKVQRYGLSRDASPMLGVAMYFSCNRERSGGVVLGHVDALRALDRAFGIDHHLGPGHLDRCVMEVCSPGDYLQICTLPISQPLSFLLYLADKAEGQKMVFLVSASVLLAEHPFRDHPVIRWLGQVAAG